LIQTNESHLILNGRETSIKSRQHKGLNGSQEVKQFYRCGWDFKFLSNSNVLRFWLFEYIDYTGWAKSICSTLKACNLGSLAVRCILNASN